MITILGPTATGKTHLAVLMADKINGEIISADSRQVYKNMDIGTGKDLSEYAINGKQIPYHLINIAEPGYAYNVHEYVRDFEKAYNTITGKKKEVVLCGGSGMYIEAVLKGYAMTNVPLSEVLRKELSQKSDTELIDVLTSLKKVHNTTDLTDRERLIRAIEIETFYKENNITSAAEKAHKSVVFGVDYPREIIRKRITERLHQRLNNGMVEEVQALLNRGVTPEQLKYYGLEYKFITQYIVGELRYDEMVNLLNIAIHQFAKRQMTWFRRMEKQGFEIHWIDGAWGDERKVGVVLKTHRKLTMES